MNGSCPTAAQVRARLLRRGFRLEYVTLGYAFTGLAVYLLVQSTVVLAAGKASSTASWPLPCWPAWC